MYQEVLERIADALERIAESTNSLQDISDVAEKLTVRPVQAGGTYSDQAALAVWVEGFIRKE